MRITLETEAADDLSKLEQFIIADKGEIKFKSMLIDAEFFSALSKMNTSLTSSSP